LAVFAKIMTKIFSSSLPLSPMHLYQDAQIYHQQGKKKGMRTNKIDSFHF